MILLLGATGYVAGAFTIFFKSREITYRALSRQELDYGNPLDLQQVIKSVKPDFVINCAGYTGKPNVDACELDKANCLQGNAVLPGVIAKVCDDMGIPWGHVSSGCIFTGNGPNEAGFREDDAPNFSFRTNNCSFYSGTKALGEETLGYHEVVDEGGQKRWLRHEKETGYIWRLRIPFNNEPSPRNYLQKLLNYKVLLEAQNSLSHLGEFVAACFACYEKQVPYGIYNLTNPGPITTSRVTEMMIEEGQRRIQGGSSNPFPRAFEFFKNEDDFMQKAAQTPRSNCLMNTDKAAAAGILMTPVEEAIEQCLRNWSTK